MVIMVMVSCVTLALLLRPALDLQLIFALIKIENRSSFYWDALTLRRILVAKPYNQVGVVSGEQ